MAQERLFGGVDAGGASFRCILATGPDDIRGEHAIPTRSPAETLAEAAAFFAKAQAGGAAIAAIGVACFGPLEPDPASPNYGRVLTTPKPGWSGVDVAGAFREATGLPIAFDTDVNAAALAERDWGAGQGLDDLAYVTVGTGIGAGVIVRGQPLHGLRHAEAGHIRPPRRGDDTDFAGVCPFHGPCIEGLASAPAIRARTGRDPAELPDDHPVWELTGFYLGHLAAALIMTVSPRRLIFGGGVMERGGLLASIRAHARAEIGAFTAIAPDGVEALIVGAGLGRRAGVLGGVALARRLTIA